MEWMLPINRLMMDSRHAPREVQETTFWKGPIPYIPADRRGQEYGQAHDSNFAAAGR